jgi:transposase
VKKDRVLRSRITRLDRAFSEEGFGFISYYGPSPLHFVREVKSDKASHYTGKQAKVLFEKCLKKLIPKVRAGLKRDGLHDLARGPLYILVDNYKPHECEAVLEVLEKLGVVKLAFPAKSPEMNLIENLWSCLKRRVEAAEVKKPSGTETELIRAVKKAWDGIPLDIYRNLFDSWESRLERCIAAQGEAFSYRRSRALK